MKQGLVEAIRLAAVRLGEIIRLGSVGLVNHIKRNVAEKPALALEDGFGFLLENGKRILTEKQGTKDYPVTPFLHSPAVNLENGFSLLLESGDRISLEKE